MSTFLTGKELEGKLTDIIWNAKKYIIIISPFIKLDDHIKEILEKVKCTHEINLFVLFGKNEEYKYKSFNDEDFKFISDFKNVAILYNKNLHAKHYCNENEGLITSLNLYGYSMINNVEYGVHFTKSFNPLDNLFEETAKFTDELIFKTSEVVFLKKPQYKKKMFGLQKEYQQSQIIFDISTAFFSGKNYDKRTFEDFDIELETSIEKKYSEKPSREINEKIPEEKSIPKNNFVSNSRMARFGYCIRTGDQIPFNPERPFTYHAFLTWNNFGDENYQENYCHYSGESSNGNTSYARPILGKNWSKAKNDFDF
tara:strand:- start:9666 stop:10601 length:936 start_codon:yes stop_codon:yes gene_type:complete